MAAAGMGQDTLTDNRATVPVAGGIYKEGVIATSEHDKQVLAAGLTNVGLVGRSLTGEITPALAISWEIPDAQTVRLTLDPRITGEQVKQTLARQTESGYWKDAELTVLDPQTIQLHVPRAWAGFVTELSAPLFPFGPYTYSKTTNQDVMIFTPNSQALAAPYFSKVELHLFPDTHALERAMRKNIVNGVFVADTELAIQPPSTWQVATPSFHREHMLFVNTRQDALKDAGVRRKLTGTERFDAPLALRLALPDVPVLLAVADDLKLRLAQQNVELTIESYPTLILTKTIVPEHNYDLLLLGVDYGPDGDLFAYWHSSQIASPGFNLAGYRNKEVDKLLEEARTIVDSADRHKRYAQVEELLKNDAVKMSFGAPQTLLYRAPNIHGNVPSILEDATDRWVELAKWYTKERRVTTSS